MGYSGGSSDDEDRSIRDGGAISSVAPLPDRPIIQSRFRCRPGQTVESVLFDVCEEFNGMVNGGSNFEKGAN